jgi:hypothetical protein
MIEHTINVKYFSIILFTISTDVKALLFQQTVLTKSVEIETSACII